METARVAYPNPSSRPLTLTTTTLWGMERTRKKGVEGKRQYTSSHRTSLTVLCYCVQQKQRPGRLHQKRNRLLSVVDARRRLLDVRLLPRWETRPVHPLLLWRRTRPLRGVPGHAQRHRPLVNAHRLWRAQNCRLAAHLGGLPGVRVRLPDAQGPRGVQLSRGIHLRGDGYG